MALSDTGLVDPKCSEVIRAQETLDNTPDELLVSTFIEKAYDTHWSKRHASKCPHCLAYSSQETVS